MRSTPRILFAMLLVTGSSTLAHATSTHQEVSRMSTHQHTIAAQIAANHVISNQREVIVDGEDAVLTRHVRADRRNDLLGGEHFSTVVDKSGLLKGFANISLDLVGKPLPSRERSEEIARAFLEEQAPDLLPRMEISWIEPHDEPIRVQRNGKMEDLTLTGMKVKARNLADGRWFWVIVGADEKPMVFERDIVWITFPGKRKTEKWLHDSWLAKQPPSQS